MNMLQIYETTIFLPDTEHALHAVVAPSRSFHGSNERVNAEEIIQALRLQKITLANSSLTAAQLKPAFAVLTSPIISEIEVIPHLQAALDPTIPSAPQALVTDVDSEFSERTSFGNTIPFEQSPLDLASLANLVLTATGAATGAYAGFVLSGPSPLLLISVPAGMVICGAAKGVADALEKGLRERLLQYLKKGLNSKDDRD